MNTPTPETDALEGDWDEFNKWRHTGREEPPEEAWPFARRLERERDAAIVNLHAAEAACAEMRHYIECTGFYHDDACPALATDKEADCECGISDLIDRQNEILSKTTLGTGWRSPEEVAKIERQAEDYRQETLRWSDSVKKLEQQLAEAQAKCKNRLCEGANAMADSGNDEIAVIRRQLAEARKDSERLEESVDLLHLIADHLETAPGPKDWWKRYFVFIGQHMVLTEEGWEPGDLDRDGIDILDEVCAPNAVANRGEECKGCSEEKGDK